MLSKGKRERVKQLVEEKEKQKNDIEMYNRGIDGGQCKIEKLGNR